ncbi:MAG: preprotein translocase subunit SecE [SAR202 cluster bacterium]|nr:preprotein translocase subunit SecE [SAR202 cluster bacterium]|tara:strand:+ start:53 stop:292 length:240 start_codon:yes stop_codon:yes gene_type:complete
MSNKNPVISPKSRAEASRKGFFSFISDAFNELKRVTWPTKEETFRLSIMVVVVSVSVGIFLGLVDLVFTELFDIILGRS